MDWTLGENGLVQYGQKKNGFDGGSKWKADLRVRESHEQKIFLRHLILKK